MKKEMHHTDTERLNWLEQHEGFGLISDDAGHWAVATAGFQNVDADMRNTPIDICSTFFIKADQLKNSIREAIDWAIEHEYA